MHKELARKVLKGVKRKFPSLNLTAEEISQITLITLSTMARFLSKRALFASARLLRYARDSVKSLSESDIQGEG